MCERRPLCHKCDDEADVLMLRGSNPTTEPFPFCRDCRGHWRHADDGVAVHWYSARGPQTTVYGAAGSKQYNGITMHLLRPDGELAVCGRVDGAGRKFNVSHTLGEDYRLCRDCLASLGRVRDDMSELAFEDFVGEVFRTAGPYDEMGGFVQWYTLPEDLGGGPQVAFFCSRSCLEKSFEMKDTYLPESPDRLVVGGAEVPRVEIKQSLSFYKDGHRTSVGIDLPGLFSGADVPYDYEGEPLYVQNRGTWIETGVVGEVVHDDDHTTLVIEKNRTIEKTHHPDPDERTEPDDQGDEAAA